jgi:hypothetical protein
MEIVYLSETSVPTYESTRRHNPEQQRGWVNSCSADREISRYGTLRFIALITKVRHLIRGD